MSFAVADTQKLTVEEFFRLEEVKPYNELIDGQVIQKKGGEFGHSSVQGYLIFTLGQIAEQFTRKPPRGHVLPEVHCIVGAPGRQWVLCPDIAYYASQRLSMANWREEPYPLVAPDMVVDILSPDESASVLAARVDFLLQHGTRLLWVADPWTREIWVHSPGRDARRLRGGDPVDAGKFLPEFEVSVADLFARP